MIATNQLRIQELCEFRRSAVGVSYTRFIGIVQAGTSSAACMMAYATASAVAGSFSSISSFSTFSATLIGSVSLVA